MKEHFYDIESLKNVFTLCNYKPEENKVDVYILCDDPNLGTDNFPEKLLDEIHAKNQNFDGTIDIYDLHTIAGSKHLAYTFGLSSARNVNDPSSPSLYPKYFRPVCDTDKNYDEDIHPYLFGYNSYNYDTTMLAEYFYETFNLTGDELSPEDQELTTQLLSTDDTSAPLPPSIKFQPPTAAKMREFNDQLFDPKFKNSMSLALTIHPEIRYGIRQWSDSDFSDPRWTIRKNMLMSGRHLDVARLNEKQSKVGLKRLLGMLGYQILESDKLGPEADTLENSQQLLELIAYNVSDVVNLYELFHHPFYQGQFSLKHGLLATYPELIYEKQTDAYEPNIDSRHVRRDRLTIDSSSAQFATKALCPYGHLTDIPTVSFMYPSERKAAELGVPRVNVLEETKEFFYSKFPQPELREQFDRIYKYYKSVEGKNFNDSKFYRDDFSKFDAKRQQAYLPPKLTPQSLNSIPKVPNCMPYYNADGTPSSCFAVFSTGGIHGAEYNVALYKADLEAWNKAKALLDTAKQMYPDPLDLRRERKITIDETEYSYTKFLKSGATIKAMTALDDPAERARKYYRNVTADRPKLFKLNNDGSTKLNPRYVYTSTDETNHEDFTSYYPNMLRMMSAFWNTGLGVDRYGEIFDNKTKYGKLMKDKSLSEEERELYRVKRQGTKLVLNAASGAGDTSGEFHSPIQMNNRIISMRIIGQLFTYRIGQAQTFAGAKITSTNTDGLYSVMEKSLNDKILAKESDDIHVEIEPESTFLISKDSNNRLEMESGKGLDGKIESASGGSLACREDTDPTKALAHPAILDWALSEYLVVAAQHYKGLGLDKPFDRNIGANILEHAKDVFELPHLLRMYQNVLASSIGTISYVFGTTKDNPGVPITLQHYNRAFIVKDEAKDTMHLHSAAVRVAAVRSGQNLRPTINDSVAVQALAAHHISTKDYGSSKEAKVVKITNIDEDWNMLIENHSLNHMTDQQLLNIYDRLDMDKYLQLFEDSYEKNWRNMVPETPASADTIIDITQLN